MAARLSGRPAGFLLVLSAALSEGTACVGCPPPPNDPDRAARPAAVIRHARLRRAAAAPRQGRLCRSPSALFRRSRFGLKPATAAADVLPAAAAAGFRRAGAAERAR